MGTELDRCFHCLSIPSASLRTGVIPVYNEVTTVAQVIEPLSRPAQGLWPIYFSDGAYSMRRAQRYIQVDVSICGLLVAVNDDCAGDSEH